MACPHSRPGPGSSRARWWRVAQLKHAGQRVGRAAGGGGTVRRPAACDIDALRCRVRPRTLTAPAGAARRHIGGDAAMHGRWRWRHARHSRAGGRWPVAGADALANAPTSHQRLSKLQFGARRRCHRLDRELGGRGGLGRAGAFEHCARCIGAVQGCVKQRPRGGAPRHPPPTKTDTRRPCPPCCPPQEWAGSSAR